MRDVAGHMVTGLEMSLPKVMGRTALAGFNINKASAKAGREIGARSTDELTNAIASANELSGFAKVLGWATKGLRLVATDVDWTEGDGPEVHGPGLSLLAMGGRSAGIDECEGDGVTLLRTL